MEWFSIHWYSISEMHLIMGTWSISDRFNLFRGAFYSSIGTNGPIGTNRMALNPLVFHWWNASHYGDLEYLTALT